MTERQVDAAASLVTGVGVLDRVIAILDTVERVPMGASELARHLGLSVPTAHRLTGAMARHGLLRRDGEGRLHPGERFAVSALSGAAEPVLEELRSETGETAQVWVRRGEDRLCLLTLDSRAELRATLPEGTRLPLADGGSAADALEGGVAGDWYESVSRRTPGLCSVSAPVLLHGEAVAAVCLAAPIARVGDVGPGRLYGPRVVAAATRIERALATR
ncbi:MULTISPECIES: IclR family transcriptional regulator [unclassified Streptomyces]|uniref:IclR family transcriptional regulator n=1 Tax=unclassified Streptomyces TaxID=2593676 RepID=UPI003BB54AE6